MQIAPDTNVLLPSIHHRSAIGYEQIYMLTGKQAKHTFLRRFIPAHEICDKLTAEELAIILPVYGISGCDTCQLFVWTWKEDST